MKTHFLAFMNRGDYPLNPLYSAALGADVDSMRGRGGIHRPAIKRAAGTPATGGFVYVKAYYCLTLSAVIGYAKTPMKKAFYCLNVV